MIHEDNPIMKELKEARDNGTLKHHPSTPTEDLSPSYWRMFYDIQAYLVKDGCTNITKKSHNIAKTLFQKWKEI